MKSEIISTCVLSEICILKSCHGKLKFLLINIKSGLYIIIMSSKNQWEDTMHIVLIIKNNLIKILASIILLLLLSFAYSIIFKTTPIISFNLPDKEQLKAYIENMYNIRSSAFITGDARPLKDLYDKSHKYGQWSLEYEVRRIKYLKDWADKRGIKFQNVTSNVTIRKIYNRWSTVRISLDESYKFDYIYKDDAELEVNSFGIGIRHTLDLKPSGEEWLIYADWYSDFISDAANEYSGTIADNNNFFLESISYAQSSKGRYYDRQKAVEYADKYCGVPWESGNNYKYNTKYDNYMGIGGDCTNFVSQVIGDKEGGGLPQDGTWFCKYKIYGGAEGSRAWVNASSFKNYLIYSGKGSIIMRGNFENLTKPLPNSPKGAIGKLKLGDLIAYEKKGDINHFTVVTGWDSHGYPLVNSHTTDRYRSPWDLGWGGKNIKFILIHING